MTTRIIAFAMLVSLIASCKKDGRGTIGAHLEASSARLTYNDYQPLKVGNYWIYRHFTIGPGNNFQEGARIDSCYVEKDTVIRGNTHYILNARHLYQDRIERQTLRDSLHYRVDAAGRIYYSPLDFTTIFDEGHFTMNQDTIGYSIMKMEHKDSIVTTPAGVFSTINSLSSLTIRPEHYPTGNPNPKLNHTIYGKDVGLVYESVTFLSVDHHLGRRLIRYKLN